MTASSLRRKVGSSFLMSRFGGMCVSITVQGLKHFRIAENEPAIARPDIRAMPAHQVLPRALIHFVTTLVCRTDQLPRADIQKHAWEQGYPARKGQVRLISIYMLVRGKPEHVSRTFIPLSHFVTFRPSPHN